MGLETDFVVNKLLDSDFEILEMIREPDSEDITLRVIHDIHPETEVMIKLVTGSDENNNEVTTMLFEGPDIYTDEEAEKVLQDVMDFLVTTIESAVIEDPDIISNNETSNEENNGNS